MGILRHAAVFAVIMLASLVPMAAAVVAQLPPAVVAGLEADRAASGRALDRARKRLGRSAEQQRAAVAQEQVLLRFSERVTTIAGFVDMRVPRQIDADLRQSTESAKDRRSRADESLASATDSTAGLQARALDADRRLRALQRAASTAHNRDTTLGSWRFGSGGPGVSAESLDRYLASKGSPLAGEGAAFLASGVEHAVDPRLIVAIAGAESYFGVTTCAPKNAWGWGCPTSPFRFDSWARGIDVVTLGIREGYLDDGLETVGQIHLRYAPPAAANDPSGLNYAWADNVARFLTEQGGDPQNVAGVLGPAR